MALPSNANLPSYPFPANARTYDFEFIRMMNQCWAAGEGIAPFDQSKDCTITAMGSNKATDLEVTTGASGLNVSVALGNAWVQGDSRSTQGLYFCYVPTATTVTMTTANGSNPRIDRIVLKVEDADAAGSVTQWSIVKVDGTATVGATLANLTGAPALPANCLHLAYVLTPTSFAGPYVNATHILDGRYFAYRPGRVIGHISASTDSNAAGDKLGPLTVVGNGVVDIDVEAKMSFSADTAGVQCYFDIRDAAAGAGNKIERAHFNVPAIQYVTTMSCRGYSAAGAGQKTFYQYLASLAGVPKAWDATAAANRRLIARYK